MKNYYKTIDGFSSIDEQGALFKTILPLADSFPYLNIAEIGVYKGRMTAMICDMLSSNGAQADYHCIDHFKGSEEHERKNYFPEFWGNIKDLDFPGVEIIITQKDSASASAIFEDGIFDVIYLDASHDYESVKADIASWLPKLRTGGILCGDDYIDGWSGVIKAVDEAFGKENVKRVATQQWYIVK